LKFENIKILENEKNIIDHTCKKNEEFRKNLSIDQYILECLSCNKIRAELVCRDCSMAYCTACYDLTHTSKSLLHDIHFMLEIKYEIKTTKFLKNFKI
jgi:hypothetical protein